MPSGVSIHAQSHDEDSDNPSQSNPPQVATTDDPLLSNAESISQDDSDPVNVDNSDKQEKLISDTDNVVST